MPDEVEEFPLLCRESGDRLVKRRPAVEVIIVRRGAVHVVGEALPRGVAAEHDIRAVIGGIGRGPCVMPGEIEELAVQLRRREGHQFAGGFDGQMTQGSIQPHGCVLEHVVGVVPAADVGELGQHAVSQGPQPVSAEGDDLVAGSKVARGEAVDAGGEG